MQKSTIAILAKKAGIVKDHTRSCCDESEKKKKVTNVSKHGQQGHWHSC